MTASRVLQLALFGYPVQHSLSPRIHQWFARSLGLSIDYQTIDCAAGELADQMNAFRLRGGRGCNITVPLKHEALTCAATMAPSVQASGAANTMVWNQGWDAYNTDGDGLIADLFRYQIEIKQKKLLIVGAGGAVAGILPALIKQVPAQIALSNRNIDKVRSLAGRWADTFVLDIADQQDPVQPFDLILQATSLGHRGAVPTMPDQWFHAETALYDLNYGAAHGAVRQWCQTRAIRCIEGTGMLVEQAARAFELFTGEQPDTGPLHQWLSAEYPSD